MIEEAVKPAEIDAPEAARSFALKPALRHAASAFGAFARRGLDLLLPPQCLACHALVDRPGLLCPACFKEAQAITPPLCRTCGAPLAAAVGIAGRPEIDLSCGSCLSDPPAFASARAVFVFDTVARALVHDLKYHDRLEGRATFGTWLAKAGADLLDTADLVVPVPLHYLRLVRRRYNQAAVLAGAMADCAGKRLAVDVLRRTRATKAQTGLSAEDRARNVRAAFAVSGRRADAVKGAQILLVDDVLTTGATANACARVLLKAGAASVSLITLARAKEPV